MNILIKIISAVLSLIIGFCSPAASERKCEPKVTGTFVQSWLSGYWDDEEWDRQIKEMKDDGLDYLILQSVAEKENGKWTVYYDSAIEEFQDAEYNGNDIIEKGLRACRKHGVKVFIGLALHDNWWLQGGNTKEYRDVCKLTADMVKEIYTRFGNEYGDTLYGWYFTPEIGSNIICTSSIYGISSGINTVLDAINEVCPEKPLMLSPFMFENSNLYMAKSVLPMWVKFFAKTNFRDGDIFCPQDSIGSNTGKLENADKMWQMYAQAVKSSDKDIRLWANCENFTLAKNNQKGSGIFKEENSESVTATLDRFVKQLDAASRYAENIITFSYNHYYSRYQCNPVFADTYNDYVKNGYQLEETAPTAVSDLKAQADDGKIVLTWTPASDNIGIAYYRITVNGKFLARVEATADGIDSSYVDSAKRLSKTVYTVTAFDGAGNASETVSTVYAG
ncbi:MAG: DUF4434 domain-containing protein [Acutalibacteraceae bacterium]